MAVVNDAMNPDSSTLDKKKTTKQNSDMFLLPPGRKHTYFSASDTDNPHSDVARLLFCLLGASIPPPSSLRSLSLLPRAALVSFPGRGDD